MESPFPPLVLDIYAFVLGALVGSFLNVVIARLPAGESIVRPRSKCPKCGGGIPAWLNVPILSWLVLRGRCAKCRAPISVRYPIVELLTAMLFLAVVRRYGWSLASLSGLILCGALVAITFIDLDTWEIPDEISLPGIAVGAVLRPLAFDVPWFDGLVGAALGASFLWSIRWFFFVVRKVEGMGLGDVKLIATIGAFVGPLGLPAVVLVSSVSGAVIGGIQLLVAPREEPATAPPKEDAGDEDDWVPPKNAVPFGPFLALGAMSTFLFGDWLLELMFRVPR